MIATLILSRTYNKLINNIIITNPIVFFITVSCVFGILFAIITPPFQGADEKVHFLRSYQISEGNFIADKEGNSIGGLLPNALDDVVNRSYSPNVATYPQLKYNIVNTKSALSVDNTENRKFYDFSAAAVYTPFSYILSAPLMKVLALFDIPPLLSLYAGRLGNLLTWIILIAISIYLLPARKWAMVSIGLLPMAIFQGATLNGDSITIGSMALFFAYILYLKFKKHPLNKKQVSLLLLITITMVLTKQVMFIFLPLIFLIPTHMFHDKKRAIITRILLIAIPLAVSIAWLLFTRIDTIPTSYTHSQNPAEQLRFIIVNPHSFINVIWNTYFYTWGNGVTNSFIGTFGWSDTPLSEIIVVIGYIGLFLLVFGTHGLKHMQMKFKDKIIIYLIMVLYWIAVTTSLYLYFSPLEYKIIYGLQGRYFIPIAILGLAVFSTKKIRIDHKLYMGIARMLPIFLLSASFITIYVRYYINNV